MKIIISVLVVIFSTSGILNAQHATNQATDSKWTQSQPFLKEFTKNYATPSAKKIRGMDMRLIAEVYERTNVTDSFIYNYVGYRGSTLEPTLRRSFYTEEFNLIEFDNRYQFAYRDTQTYFIKSACTYNANDLVTTQIDSQLINAIWTPTNKLIFTYNTSNQITKILTQNWYGTSTGWRDSYKRDFIYGAQNIQSVISAWNIILSAWENSFKFEDLYSGTNHIERSTYNWTNNAWVGNAKVIMAYNTANQLVTAIRQSMQGTTWINNYKTTTTYNTSNNISQTEQQAWNGTSWNDFNRSLMTWAGNTVSTIINQTFNIKWINVSRDTYTYNANDYPITSIRESWDSISTAFIYSPSSPIYDGKKRYYYEPFNNNVRVEDVKETFGSIDIFPNPTQNKFTIHLDKQHNTVKHVVIIDMTGTVVATTNIAKDENKVQINISTLLVGNYIVQVNDDNGNFQSAMITKN